MFHGLRRKIDRWGISPSRLLLGAAGGFVAGAVSHAWDDRVWLPALAGPAWPFAFAAVGAAAAVAARRSAARFCLPVAAALACGIVRYDAALASRPEAASLPKSQAEFVGRVAEEPKNGVSGAVLVMDRVFVAVGGIERPTGVEMRLSFTLPSEATVGDLLSWSCRPYVPKAVTSAHAPWRCSPREPPRTIARGSRWRPANVLLRLKDGARDTVRSLLPEPDASLVLGLLIGDDSGVPKDLVDTFRSTGTSHVLAVSGYNVTLVANFAFVAFAAAGAGRKRAALLVAATLACFAQLSGSGPPVVRAALMGGVGVLAARLGRRNAGLAPLFAAAALMIAHDPLIVAEDVGFRLSFAAVVGMRMLGKPLERLCRWAPETFGLREGLSQTIAATLATLPISLHDFGSLPVATVPVNMAIAPLVPLATASGGAALLVGLVGRAVVPGGEAAALPLALLAAAATSAMRAAAAIGDRHAPAVHVQVSAVGALGIVAALLVLWLALRKLYPEDR